MAKRNTSGRGKEEKVYQVSTSEQIKRAEKQAFFGCVASIAGLPMALIGFGMVLGIAGLIMGWKARRPDGNRPLSAKVAIVAGIISIIVGIPGWIVIYGTYINPDSAFVQNLVNTIFGIENLILVQP